MDGGSNVIALIAIKIAERPADEDHPYGHRKFETLGALAISGLLCLASWEILQSAWERLIHPVELPQVRWIAVAGLVFMILLNLAITWYEQKWGRRLNSELLLADSKHTLSDAMASVLALVALLSALKQLYWVDTLAALVIVVLILRAAYQIVKDSVLTLSDAQRLNPEPIQRLVEQVNGVENCHMVRSHGPIRDVRVDLHIVIAPDLSAEKAFEIENEVMRRVKEAYPEVTEVTIRHQTKMPGTRIPA
jgi:cation diffusion facilitator family transporter